MDFVLLIDQFSQARDISGWSRQRVLHECLHDAIRSGKLAAGTRLLASRVLALELGDHRHRNRCAWHPSPLRASLTRSAHGGRSAE